MRTTDTMAKHIVDMALQRLCGVSVQHCVGVWDFHGIEVLIRPPILVPRPETEELVDWILDSYRPDLAKNTPFRFLDIGAGSGCIGLALLKASNQHRAWGKAIIARAIDINPVAVAMATENAQRLGLDGPYTCTQMSVDDIGTDMATAEVEVNNPIHTGVQETGAARAGTPCSSDHCVGVSSDRSIHMPAYQRSIHMPTYQHVANEENHSADECDRPLNDPSQRQTVDLQRTQGAKHMACNPSYARNTQHTVQTSDKDRVSAGGDVSFSPELCPPVLTTTTRQGLLADDKLGLFHMVVSNPPYIPIADYEGLATEVRDHEDFGALIAGEDGLSVINRILDKADAGLLLLSGGSLYMEVDTTHPALLSERLQSMPSPEYAVGTLAYTEPREDSDIGCLEKYKDVGSNGNSSKNTPGTGLEVEVNLKIETSSWRWPNLRYAETRRDIYGNERFCRIIYGPDLNDAQTIASKK
ncbi:hypothetical protein SARC_07667 [Sphaeroforma arctica JP610]|uniref:Methyltransferase small domain-containing protein n=1 Tax=Sphaeroforma arctica JP610 TaxID=667725 RepID=A0A0L0FTP7_9EUKA|nr:hypothetical protein SARC_07667 [Sphaeroforma arctica JP610]KNC79951.1 hypothetical protein SARC_07667 [Sphaeroforma arctica JP610]|eukprot:XP_014153853.1 hypothetical protein SARC_07667 [Sphaeroforma arctica JP610]